MAVVEFEHPSSQLSTANVVNVHAKTYIILATLNFAYIAQLVVLVGAGILAQSIQKLFGGNNENSWFVQAVTIFTVVLSPPLSQIADLWGRKWPLVISMLLGCVGAIVVSRAQSMGTAIAGFCVIGLSFGAQSLMHAIVSEILPRKQRPLAQASFNASASIGAIVGICMAGTLLRYDSLENYRLYMYVTAGILFAAMLGALFFYNPPPRELQTSLTNREKLRRLDWIGYLLFASGLVLFCVGLSYSQNPYPWANARVSATFAGGVILMITFFVYEWRFKTDGMLNHDLFKNRNFPLTLLAIFAEGLTFFTANNYFAFEITIFTGDNLLMSGLHFAVTFIACVCFALLSGLYSSNRKSLRLPTVTGFLLILIFNICMAATYGGNPGNAFWGFAVILGVGLGTILPSIMVTAQLCTPPNLISTASALIISTRSFGGTVGLAVNNAIFNSALSNEIPKKVAAATLPLGLPITSLGQLIKALTSRDRALLARVPGITPKMIVAAEYALVRAYGVSFRNCWIAASCFCFVAVVASLFLFDPSDEFTAHIDAPAEEKVAEKQAMLEGVTEFSAYLPRSKKERLENVQVEDRNQ